MNCQTVCALRNAGLHDRSASAIRVNLQLFSGKHTHIYCRQCENPECRKACPVDAVYMNTDTGAWKINSEICVMCGSCVAACPFGAMFNRNTDGLPFKCDLCDGKPACEEACVFNAITFKKDKP